jgi:hypothetical protein
VDKGRCSQCGEEHDLSDIEPSFDRPDAWSDIPEEERSSRTWDGGKVCVLREMDSAPRRHYLRVVLPIPVRGEAGVYNWGVWVEVSAAHFDVTLNRWEDPEQSSEAPFPGLLANELPDMPPTLGLGGSVQLVGPERVPDFFLDPTIDHPFVREQEHGVFPERLLEWSMRAIHANDPE